MAEQYNYYPPRYGTHDEYILEEIRRRYVYGGREARLRVLTEAYDAQPLPFELARLAVEDSDPLIRGWMARNARDLDFREQVHQAWDEDAPDVLDQPKQYRYPDRDLWERLRSDTDPFVRASLYENPRFPPYGLGGVFEIDFEPLPHDHRLALMRNPCLASFGVDDLVLKVFDATDETLALTPEHRAELALAFLSNTAVIEKSRVDLDGIKLWQ